MPSFATIERYVNGEMTADEQKRMEASIASDPLLADAVEGYRMSMADSQLVDRLARIRRQVTASAEALPEPSASTSKRKSRVKPFPQYLVYTAIAAGIALLLVFVGLMGEAEETDTGLGNEIAQNEPAPDQHLPESSTKPPVADAYDPEPSPAPDRSGESASRPAPAPQSAAQPSDPEASIATPPLTEDMSLGEASDRDMAISTPGNGAENDLSIRNASPVPATIPGSEGGPGSMTAPAASTSADDPAFEEEAAVVTTNEPDEEELIRLQKEAVAATSPVVRERSEQVQARQQVEERRNSYNRYDNAPAAAFEPNDIPPQDSFDKQSGQLDRVNTIADMLQYAIDLYDRGDTDSSLIVLEEVLLSESENVVANYMKGLVLLDTDRAKEAIDPLELAVEAGNSELFEEARRNLVDAYLKSGKKRKARSLLSDMAEEPGLYQQEAIQLLENPD